jgi:hypothetical protein
MSMIKIDDSVKICGGKSNKCEGIVTSLKNVFVLVRITKDKKGQPMFGDKPIKVKKSYIEVIAPPPIEMPTQDDLIVMDTSSNQNIFETIDENIANPFLPQAQDNPVVAPLKQTITEVVEPPYMVNENNVKEPAITIDDAINYRDDNVKLTFKMDSMVSFQNMACEEIGKLKFEIKQLKEQLGDSVRMDKLEEIKMLINSI